MGNTTKTIIPDEAVNYNIGEQLLTTLIVKSKKVVRPHRKGKTRANDGVMELQNRTRRLYQNRGLLECSIAFETRVGACTLGRPT